jgi:hypothetical protein
VIHFTENNAKKIIREHARLAMNTIPTIFNETITPYTAVGGKERLASTGISAVILNRPGHVRKNIFHDLEKTGFDNVISIESCKPHYEIEEMAGRFPFVRFILPEKEINLGEQINLAASEVESPLFFVLHSDMKIIAGGTARRMAERLSVNHEETDKKLQNTCDEKKAGFIRLCTVPLIMSANYETLPSLVAPMTHRRKMRTIFREPQNEGDKTLYPFDGIGIYDRQRFIHTGGFDVTLNHTHWQLMDFGLRAHLWGEEIAANLHFKLSYESEMPSENYSVDDNYRRFYLKNLAPVFRSDYAHLPLYRFPGYFFKCTEGFFTAWKEFKNARNWVIKNKFRYRCDAHSVIKSWSVN